jgi:hypothetical protein
MRDRPVAHWAASNMARSAAMIEFLAGTHGIHHLGHLLPGRIIDIEVDLEVRAASLILRIGFESANQLRLGQMKLLNPVIHGRALDFPDRTDTIIVLKASGEAPRLAIGLWVTCFEVHAVDAESLREVLDSRASTCSAVTEMVVMARVRAVNVSEVSCAANCPCAFPVLILTRSNLHHGTTAA